MASEDKPSPFLYRPDPDNPGLVQAKGLRLERRGPKEYFIVGVTHDGRPAEAQIVPLSFEMPGS
jgi:hypothetical protein